jgi:signal transduction histidine kinase/DNA-binding response OmpR family regulator
MNRLRDLPIRQKLTVMILLSSTAVLLLTGLAFVTYELITFRRSMVRDLAVLADVLGQNTIGALSFQDETAAAKTLSALSAEPHIVLAALYDKDGTRFAQYVRADWPEASPERPSGAGHRFEHDRLVLFRPILLNQKQIGTICLEADLAGMHERFQSYVGIVLLILTGAFLVTLAFSSRFQRPISEPILALARTAKVIAEKKDYSVRAADGSRDEIGLFTGAFNQMLAGIEERDTALQKANQALQAEIADRQRAEVELQALNETLEQRVAERTAAAEAANHAKSDFLANMSHELRTPLNSVIGFSNILLKNKARNLRPEDLSFLERILANGRHLLNLINQILDLSKIEARKTELELGPVALDVLVPEIIAQFEGQLRGRDVKLLAALPQPLAPLHADAGKLKQILINLIGNALKFTEQGSVTVRVVAQETTHYPVRIEVTDTGIGIPRDRLSAIFEAFQQAETGTARKYGGTGLGLTISRALCELLEYRLEVRSELGKGSTFSVLLPPGVAMESKPLPSAAAAAAGPDYLKDKLVLVIDDEMDARILLIHLIEELGCKVIAASSGEHGLRMAREFRPDLITLDLLMPEMSGRDVLKAIKADARLQHIPVVVVSIVARENRGSILGAVDVLEKPLSREELLAVLRRTLRPGKKLLVVDDDADTRRLITCYLEDETVEIQTAADGLEALEILKGFSPDVVLLDLMMPRMDGMSFLDAIRADPRHRQLPVVIVTAKVLTPEEARRLDADAQAVLKKTEILEEELRCVLRELLQKSAATLSMDSAQGFDPKILVKPLNPDQRRNPGQPPP